MTAQSFSVVLLCLCLSLSFVASEQHPALSNNYDNAHVEYVDNLKSALSETSLPTPSPSATHHQPTAPAAQSAAQADSEGYEPEYTSFVEYGGKPIRTLTNLRRTGAASKLTRADTRCVICQYIVQRVHNAVMQYSASAVPVSTPGLPAMAGGGMPPGASAVPGVFLETESTVAAESEMPSHTKRNMATNIALSSFRTSAVEEINELKDVEDKIKSKLHHMEMEEEVMHDKDSKLHPANQQEVEDAARDVVDSVFLEMQADAQLEQPPYKESELRGNVYIPYRYGNRDYVAAQTQATEALPRRYRFTDILHQRPREVRFNPLAPTQPGPNREFQRMQYEAMYQLVYRFFENLCTSRMPEAYMPYCGDLLNKYRYIAQGIHFGDRPDQICMFTNFCSANSYVRFSVHSMYKREPGDAVPYVDYNDARDSRRFKGNRIIDFPNTEDKKAEAASSKQAAVEKTKKFLEAWEAAGKPLKMLSPSVLSSLLPDVRKQLEGQLKAAKTKF